MAMLLCSPISFAQTVTPNLNLTLPADHQPNWGPIINNDLTIIDTFAGNTGTVKSITVGNLLPIFSSSVSSPNASPVISFSLNNAPPHTFFGNNTNNTGNPSYVQPSFTDIGGLALPSQMPAFSGDATTVAGATVITLNLLNASPGTCGDGTHVCQVTTNSKGLVLSQNAIPISTTGVGTVTSVGVAVPSWLSVSGSPVTSAGTITISSAAGQTANRFLATPNGTAGPLGIRAIVGADLPLGTTATPGAVRCDGSTITCTGGVISAAPAGGGITGSGTPNTVAMFVGGATTIGDSHLDDGNTLASTISATEDFQTATNSTATSSANFSSPNSGVMASYWNGTAATNDFWRMRDVLGVGTNPTSTLTFTHSGSSGVSTISFPSIVSGTYNPSVSIAPTGSCPVNGSRVISIDGQESTCVSGFWSNETPNNTSSVTILPGPATGGGSVACIGTCNAYRGRISISVANATSGGELAHVNASTPFANSNYVCSVSQNQFGSSGGAPTSTTILYPTWFPGTASVIEITTTIPSTSVGTYEVDYVCIP